MLRRTLQRFGYAALILPVLVSSLGLTPSPAVAAAGFNPSRVVDDSVFINIDKMSVAEVQAFLELKGSFLKDFSENGRTAAQIIWGAAHGHGEASGDCNNTTVCFGIDINTRTGTVNPEVILVTLQKEQSLITRTERSDSALRTAMGYGCPDSGGCNPDFAGFTKQVEHAAWQLRFNYERAQGKGFGDYQVGQSFCTSDHNGTNCGSYENRATAALYRYTPHVYNGNYNFHHFLVTWFEQRDFGASLFGRSPDVTLDPGGTAELVALVRNTGSETWQKSGRYPFQLGTVNPKDNTPPFIREDRATNRPSGWRSPNRVVMQQDSVAPNGLATFKFYITAPSGMGPGDYHVVMAPVADGYKWVEDFHVSWRVRIRGTDERYQASWGGQNDGPRLVPGMSYKFTVALKNSGTSTWTQDVVHLGTAGDLDRISHFTREDVEDRNPSGWVSPNRIQMQESSVAPGSVGHFDFYMSVPAGTKPGRYREYFRPVADGVTWMNDLGIYWDITVL